MFKKLWQNLIDWKRKRNDVVRLRSRLTTAQRDLLKTSSGLNQQADTLQEELTQTKDDLRIARLTIREHEETIQVNRLTIENLTYETARNRERIRADVAVEVTRRKQALEGTETDGLL